MTLRVLALVLFALHVAAAQSCSSRFYCKSSNVRFMSMRQLNDVHLNVTIIKTATARKISDCQVLCLKQQGCFSININISNIKRYECQLLSGNLYTNKSLLVKNKDFIHLFIQSPCKKNPCKHEGVCLPSYINDAYSCKCKINATFIASGNDCENVASGTKSADYYWTFDKTTQNQSTYFFHAESGTITDVSFKFRATSTPTLLYVPNRRTPVAYRQAGSTLLETDGTIPCLTTFTGCQTGVSYSIWIRFAKRQTLNNVNSHPVFCTHSVGSYWGVKFSAHPDATRGFGVIIIPFVNEKWSIIPFGKKVKRTRWNHFMITFEKQGPLCAYVNGVMAKCRSEATSTSVTNSSRVFRLGQEGDNLPRTEMFIDDFAVWKSCLSADDVKEVYNSGKA